MHTSTRKPGRPARPVTREQLLRVAQEAFSELGYAGASMDNIASRAGIRKSSLFHHFATKDELYKEALAAAIGHIGATLVEGQSSDGSIRDRLAGTSRAVGRYLGNNPLVARLLLRELLDGSHAFATAGSDVDQVIHVGIALLQDGMKDGALATQDARHLVMSMVGMHLLFFALPDLTSHLFGPLTPELVEQRAQVVADHADKLLR